MTEDLPAGGPPEPLGSSRHPTGVMVLSPFTPMPMSTPASSTTASRLTNRWLRPRSLGAGRQGRDRRQWGSAHCRRRRLRRSRGLPLDQSRGAFRGYRLRPRLRPCAMDSVWDFVLRHGYASFFAAVFIEQIGAPVPALPVLVAMGALAGLGNYSLTAALLTALVAALFADWAWFELGRRRGSAVLNFLCRISLEPDSCVRSTRSVWDRWGGRTLLISKFVPGLSTVAPPSRGHYRHATSPLPHFRCSRLPFLGGGRSRFGIPLPSRGRTLSNLAARNRRLVRRRFGRTLGRLAALEIDAQRRSSSPATSHRPH